MVFVGTFEMDFVGVAVWERERETVLVFVAEREAVPTREAVCCTVCVVVWGGVCVGAVDAVARTDTVEDCSLECESVREDVTAGVAVCVATKENESVCVGGGIGVRVNRVVLENVTISECVGRVVRETVAVIRSVDVIAIENVLVNPAVCVAAKDSVED